MLTDEGKRGNRAWYFTYKWGKSVLQEKHRCERNNIPQKIDPRLITRREYEFEKIGMISANPFANPFGTLWQYFEVVGGQPIGDLSFKIGGSIMRKHKATNS